MTCEEIQSRLLEGDAVEAVVSSDGVRAHVAQCAACGELAARLRRLEGAAASLPPAPGSAEARARFEEKLRAMPARAPRRAVIWRITPIRVAVAAMLLLAGGIGAWTYLGNEHKAVASAETIDQLVAMNLSLTQTESPAERQQLLARHSEDLKQTLGNAPFTDGDREVADALIRDSAFLAANRDPLAEADHFGQVADLLVNRMDHAAKKSPKALDRLGKTYFSVVERGVNRNLERATEAGELTDAQSAKLEKVLARQARLQARLERLLEQSPDASKPQIRKSLDLTQKPKNAKKKPAKETF